MKGLKRTADKQAWLGRTGSPPGLPRRHPGRRWRPGVQWPQRHGPQPRQGPGKPNQNPRVRNLPQWPTCRGTCPWSRAMVSRPKPGAGSGSSPCGKVQVTKAVKSPLSRASAAPVSRHARDQRRSRLVDDTYKLIKFRTICFPSMPRSPVYFSPKLGAHLPPTTHSKAIPHSRQAQAAITQSPRVVLGTACPWAPALPFP